MDLPRGYLSYNQIRLYQNCPLKYYLSYVKEIQFPINDKVYLGIVFHAVLEEYFKRKIAGEEPEKFQVIDIFNDLFKSLEDNNPVEWDSPKGKVKDRGIAFTRHFLKEMAPAIEPLMTEKELETTIPELNIKIKGVIDLVEQDFSITDFKTTTAKWSKSRISNSLLQMVIYKYLFEKNFGDVNPDLLYRIIYSKNALGIRDQKVKIKGSDVDYEKMLKIIGYVADNISNGVFYDNPSYMCGFCEHKDICQEHKKNIS